MTEQIILDKLDALDRRISEWQAGTDKAVRRQLDIASGVERRARRRTFWAAVAVAFAFVVVAGVPLAWTQHQTDRTAHRIAAQNHAELVERCRSTNRARIGTRTAIEEALREIEALVEPASRTALEGVIRQLDATLLQTQPVENCEGSDT